MAGIVIKTFGISEEEVTALIKEFCRFKTITITTEAETAEVTLRIGYTNKVTKSNIDYVTDGIYGKLKDYIWADYDTTLGKAVVDVMRQREKTLAVAESVTGGMLSSMIVDNSGASSVLKEGLTVYTDEAKVRRLGVSENTLLINGAVSAETAYEMAAGLLEQSGADLAAATTGYADPDDAEHGLVFIAVGDGAGIHVYPHKFAGGRNAVRTAAAKTALYYILKRFK